MTSPPTTPILEKMKRFARKSMRSFEPGTTATSSAAHHLVSNGSPRLSYSIERHQTETEVIILGGESDDSSEGMNRSSMCNGKPSIADYNLVEQRTTSPCGEAVSIKECVVTRDASTSTCVPRMMNCHAQTDVLTPPPRKPLTLTPVVQFDVAVPCEADQLQLRQMLISSMARMRNTTRTCVCEEEVTDVKATLDRLVRKSSQLTAQASHFKRELRQKIPTKSAAATFMPSSTMNRKILTKIRTLPADTAGTSPGVTSPAIANGVVAVSPPKVTIVPVAARTAPNNLPTRSNLSNKTTTSNNKRRISVGGHSAGASPSSGSTGQVPFQRPGGNHCGPSAVQNGQVSFPVASVVRQQQHQSPKSVSSPATNGTPPTKRGRPSIAITTTATQVSTSTISAQVPGYGPIGGTSSAFPYVPQCRSTTRTGVSEVINSVVANVVSTPRPMLLPPSTMFNNHVFLAASVNNNAVAANNLRFVTAPHQVTNFPAPSQVYSIRRPHLAPPPRGQPSAQMPPNVTIGSHMRIRAPVQHLAATTVPPPRTIVPPQTIFRPLSPQMVSPPRQTGQQQVRLRSGNVVMPNGPVTQPQMTQLTLLPRLSATVASHVRPQLATASRPPPVFSVASRVRPQLATGPRPTLPTGMAGNVRPRLATALRSSTPARTQPLTPQTTQPRQRLNGPVGQGRQILPALPDSLSRPLKPGPYRGDIPPPPILAVTINRDNGVVLEWKNANIPRSASFAEVLKFEIACCQVERSSTAPIRCWNLLSPIDAISLPMVVTLAACSRGTCYYFVVRGIDKYNRAGPFSNVQCCDLNF